MAFAGAVIVKSADQTTANYNSAASGSDLNSGGVAISWDTATYDTDTFYSGGAPTRLTVPAAFDGMSVVLTCQATATLDASTSKWLSIRKNGSANFEGNANVAFNTVADPGGHIHTQTPPIVVATGDYFEAFLFSNDSSITIESDRSSFGIRVLDPPPTFQGVLCKKLADQTAANYSTSTAISWDGDEYDTDSAHDTSSSNTKIIVPSAWNGKLAVFTASARLTSVTSGSTLGLKIVKGGVDGWAGFAGMSASGVAYTEFHMVAVTQAVLLATAEEYEAKLLCSDTSITVEGGSTFGCRIVG